MLDRQLTWLRDPVVYKRWIGAEEMNRALAQQILVRAATIPSNTSHNKTAWRSSNDLHTWQVPCVTRLCEMISTMAPVEKILRAWAIVNKAGSAHPRHVHQGKRTGIYYVDDGDAQADTIFELDGGDVRIAPELGLMIIFPAQTWHRSDPHTGARERITIAFDLGLLLQREYAVGSDPVP